VILAPHHPDWSAEFARLRDTYSSCLGDLIVVVEHVGSTAVPDLLAKPILDIDIVMARYSVFPEIVARLRGLGYEHSGDQGIPGREAFKAVDDSAPHVHPRRQWMPHHLYVCPSDAIEPRRHLAFRDALRAREDLRREYEKRKLDIAARSGGDRKVYAQIKEVECRDFVERALAMSFGN
jgi:GrpB-like predicted nucleotidyltransferase (UPF0157 family)